jgi:methionyl-tRNA formyltransferase
VDWALDSIAIWCRQRAVTPWPGATTGFRGARLKLERTEPEGLLPAGAPAGTVLGAGAEGVRVACGLGSLRITSLKPEGRASLSAADWAHGARLKAGERFVALEEVAT